MQEQMPLRNCNAFDPDTTALLFMRLLQNNTGLCTNLNKDVFMSHLPTFHFLGELAIKRVKHPMTRGSKSNDGERIHSFAQDDPHILDFKDFKNLLHPHREMKVYH